MTSISPSATFAPSSATPHDGAANRLGEAIAKASPAEIQTALSALNDELLGTLSSFAGAIVQDRAMMRSKPKALDAAWFGPAMRTETFYYRDHAIEPTTMRSRSGLPLYCITGPLCNEFVAVGNVKLRIDGYYKRAERDARGAAS